MTTPTLGHRVADLRRLQGFSQRELAKRDEALRELGLTGRTRCAADRALVGATSPGARVGVSVRDLRPDALTESGDDSPVPNDIDTLTADALVTRHAAAWQAATVHPFLAGVRDGSLPEDSFDRWLAQD